MKQTKREKTLFTLSVVAVLLAVVSLIVSLISLNHAQESITASSKSLALVNYDHFRLAFCYDNQIRPCDDTSISKWNDEHPDNQLSLKRPLGY